MALHHLLFRCPKCGHDPMGGEGDAASCPGCGRTFTRVRRGREILVDGAGEAAREERIETLLEKIEALGGALSTATAPDGRISRSADALMRTASEEEPLRFRGSVLGFVEHLGEGRPGRLHLQGEALWFEVADQGGAAEDTNPGLPQDEGAPSRITWDLLEIRAVQSASAAVQISPSDGGVVQFQFTADSPYRWEALLKAALQRAYRGAGRGDIMEFQPRIVTG